MTPWDHSEVQIPIAVAVAVIVTTVRTAAVGVIVACAVQANLFVTAPTFRRQPTGYLVPVYNTDSGVGSFS